MKLRIASPVICDSIVDGPGLRMVIWTQGCKHNCKGCHNPQTHSLTKGYEVDTKEIINKMASLKLQQGITLSGGEPMVRPEFAYALLRTLTERWIDTAIETCGYAKTEDYEQIVPYLNTIFMDLKHMNSEKHKQWTGHGNELILMNIKRVNDMIPVYGNRMFIRIPIIPGFNDKPEEVEETAAFVAKNCTNITGMELLPYHKLGRGKYYSLGREYEMESTVPPTTEKMNELNEILNKYDIPIFKF